MTTTTRAAPAAATVPPALETLRAKRLLVTGAAGFIGGALLRRLAAAGCRVTGAVRDPGEAAALRAEGHRAEVLDLASAAPFAPRLQDFDVVFHLAALFQEAEHGEALYRTVNVEGTLKLCREAARAGVERFVHCSTVGVYGDVKEIPCKETSPLNPMDLYHRTKLAGELAVLDFARRLPPDGMVVTVNRPAMVYGRATCACSSSSADPAPPFLHDRIGRGSGPSRLHRRSGRQLPALRRRPAGEGPSRGLQHRLGRGGHPQRAGSDGGGSRRRRPAPGPHPGVSGVACGRGVRAGPGAVQVAPAAVPPPGRLLHPQPGLRPRQARARLGYVSRWDHRRGLAETIRWYREQGLV